MKTKDLENIGFVHIANWSYKGNGNNMQYDKHRSISDADYNTIIRTSSALYAFCVGDDVMYIGRTARSIKKRFVGYCNPGNGQATNARCNGEIREIIYNNKEVSIYVFTPVTHLEWAGFSIDLAAALEDSLIREFRPPWNRTLGAGNVNTPNDGGRTPRMSESAESEEEATAADGGNGGGVVTPAAAEEPQPHTFTIELGQTYYNHGFINPGVVASQHLGAHGDPVLIEFSDGAPSIQSRINRTANQNGSVRIIGNNGAIASWFQANFNPGDTVNAEVTDRNTIRLLAP